MAEGTSENVLAWTVSNWITVVLMAGIGFTLFGLAQKLYQSRNGNGS